MRAAPRFEDMAERKTIFVCLEQDYEMALSLISVLVIKAVGEFGDLVDRWFFIEALQEIDGVEINDVGEVVSSRDEDMLDALINEQNGISIELPDDFEVGNNRNNAYNDAKSAYSFGSEMNVEDEGNMDASVSTFVSGMTSALTEESSTGASANGQEANNNIENNQAQNRDSPSTGLPHQETMGMSDE